MLLVSFIRNISAVDVLMKCNENTGLTDESGELAAALTAKYLANAELGNFASMAPGLIDVSVP